MLDILTTNLPILICFLAGTTLLVLETFLPGFGAFGISGIVLQGAAVILTWMNYGTSFALALLLIMLSLMTLAISMSLRSAAKGRISRSELILKDTESSPAAEDMSVLQGREGIALTALRPAGTADFDGVRFDVVTAGEFIEKDTPVRIVKTEGSRMIVRAVRTEK